MGELTVFLVLLTCNHPAPRCPWHQLATHYEAETPYLCKAGVRRIILWSKRDPDDYEIKCVPQE